MARNTAASVHRRLLNMARETSRPFNELLQLYAIERFIYRLSQSSYADRFILKGALMLLAWNNRATRPTLDIDLLGKIANTHAVIIAAMQEICDIEVEADGMSYKAETVRAARIAEDAEYEGVRVRLQGELGNAQIYLQIDIGFGDVLVPGPGTVIYPSLLGFTSPVVYGYSIESIIAEKFHAMVKHGVLNSRMKDFYDVWLLSRSYGFVGAILTRAIAETFKNRNTPVPAAPTVFDPSFVADNSKQAQWNGFVTKAKLLNTPQSFDDITADIKVFLKPIVDSLVQQQAFDREWTAPGPWR